MSGRNAEDFNLEEKPKEEELTPEQTALKEEQDKRAKLEVALEEQRKQSEKMLLHIIDQSEQEAQRQQAAEAAAEREPKKETPLPDKEEDPEAYQEALIAKRIKEGVEAAVAPLVKQSTMDRSTMLEGAKHTAREAARKTFGKAFDEIETDIEGYLKRIGGPEILANPANWEEGFYRIAGRASYLASQETASREEAAEDGRGRPSATADGARGGTPAPRLEGTAERLAAFEHMTKDDIADFSGKSMDIDDFLVLKGKKEKRGVK